MVVPFLVEKRYIQSAIDIVRALPDFNKLSKIATKEIWLSDCHGGGGTRMYIKCEDEGDGTYLVGAAIDSFVDAKGQDKRFPYSTPGFKCVPEHATGKNVQVETKKFKDQIIAHLQKLTN